MIGRVDSGVGKLMCRLDRHSRIQHLRAVYHFHGPGTVNFPEYLLHEQQRKME